MSLIINQILVLFIIILLGFILKKMNIIDEFLIKKLSGLLLTITMPALIISSMQLKQVDPTILKECLFIFVFSGFTYLVSILFAIVVTRLTKCKKDDIGVYRFMLVFANVGFMGYPVLTAILGKESLFYGAIFNLPFNFLVYTIGIYFLKKKNQEKNDFTWKIFINPGVVAVLLGLVLFVFDIKLPFALEKAVSMVGDLTVPLSMLIIGGVLTNIHLKEVLSNWRIYLFSLLRLIVFPLMVLWIVRVFTSNELIIGTAFILTAMPMATNGVILAEQYDGNARLASETIFISTLLSIITIPVIAMFL